MAGEPKSLKAKVDGAGYAQFLAAMKARVSHARSCAARAVNHELVLLYWVMQRRRVSKWSNWKCESLFAAFNT